MPPGGIATITEALRAFFAAPPPGTAAVYVFGSVARGTAGLKSDVDVAILFDTDPPHTLDGLHLELRDRLQEAIGRQVDLLVLNDATADLVHRVLHDGLLVAEPNRAVRIAFEVRLRNVYFDLERVRQEYRQPVTGSIVR